MWDQHFVKACWKPAKSSKYIGREEQTPLKHRPIRLMLIGRSSIFFKSNWYYWRKLSGAQLLLLCMKQKMWGFGLWNQTLSLWQDWAPEHPAVLKTGFMMMFPHLPPGIPVTKGTILFCRLRRESNSWTLSKHADTTGCLWWFVSLDLSHETWGLQSKFLELPCLTCRAADQSQDEWCSLSVGEAAIGVSRWNLLKISLAHFKSGNLGWTWVTYLIKIPCSVHRNASSTIRSISSK